MTLAAAAFLRRVPRENRPEPVRRHEIKGPDVSPDTTAHTFQIRSHKGSLGGAA